MLARRFLALLVLATSACLDAETEPFGVANVGFPRDESGYELINGTVLPNGMLRTDEGWDLRLTGPQTRLLTQLVDARIHVRGTRDEGGTTPVYVVEFRVLVVDKLAALDGVLHATEGSHRIQSGDQFFTLPPSLPSGLTNHVGKRVWVTLSNGAVARFGVLEL